MITKKYSKSPFTLIIGILIIVALILYVKLKAPADNSQIYRNMINSAFGTFLDETNSNLKYTYEILSIDSVYLISFVLSDDYIIKELNEENGWKNDFDSILEKYIIPYEKDISGLDLIIKTSQTELCYYKLVILNESPENFKIGIIIPSEKTLYFFYLTF